MTGQPAIFGMNPRIQKHAEVLVDHSVNIESGDNVLIQAPPVAEDLTVALHEQIGNGVRTR